MRFENQRESSNIEDQRGAGGHHRAGGQPFRGMRLPIRGGGIGTILILILLAWFAGINPLQLLGLGGGSPGGSFAAGPTSDTPLRTTPEEEARKSFVAMVLATTEECWHNLFEQKLGRRYEEPKLVLFRDGVSSACGFAESAMGPFYCPGDHKVYIDLAFFDDLQQKLGARGDFAQAYVVAHEVGHHVQNLIGTSDEVHALHGRVSEQEYNRASVKLELQADYFAGVWAHYVKHRMQGRAELEIGDYEEAIGAAHAVGDDTLQKRSTGRIVPENFTHGTSEQRKKWFRLGFESGDPTARDPFKEER
jgi:predicted metalloprotease